jgi:hypothetical protein
MNKERGSVLLQVLVMATLTGIICATVLRARFQPALTAQSAVSGVSNDLSAQTSLNRVNEVWARSGSCSSDANMGVACSGSGCSCVCTVSGAADVISAPNGNYCAMTVSMP